MQGIKKLRKYLYGLYCETLEFKYFFNLPSDQFLINLYLGRFCFFLNFFIASSLPLFTVQKR